MNKHKLTKILSTTFLAAAPFFTIFFTSESTIAQETSELTEDKKNLPNLNGANVRTIRLAVVKGFLDIRNQIKKVDLNLQWDLLPEETESLLDAARRDFIIPTTIIIPNDSLGYPEKWTKYLDKDARRKLQKALFVNDLTNFNSDASKIAFQKYWIDKNGNGAKLVRNQGENPLLADEFYGVVLDYKIINLILASRGIEYYFDVNDAPTIGKFPRILNKDIKWKIKIYEFEKQGVPYYRFTIKAILDNFELRFPASYSKDTELYTAVRLRKDKNFKPPELTPRTLLGESPIVVESSSLKVDNFSESLNLDDSKIVTELNTTLGSLGTQVAGVVNAGFLSGTQNATFIGGTVLDLDDGDIKPLVGANWRILNISNNVSGGLVFGVEPSADASIFFGPSIQADILTVAAGARFAGGNENIETNLAGVVSLDLSRLSGSRPDVQPLKFGKAEAGGNWFKALDFATKGLAMIGWTLRSDKKDNRCSQFSLSPIIKSEAGSETPAIKPLVPQISLPLAEDEIKFVPFGSYKYNVDEGCNLYIEGNLVQSDLTVNVDDGKLKFLSKTDRPFYICHKENASCIKNVTLNKI